MSDASHRELAASVAASCRLTGDFLLRSGQRSEFYFDKYRFEGNPDLLRRVAALMLKTLPSDTQVLAGLELGGIPLATAMALQSGLQIAFVRKLAKSYGTCKTIEGDDVGGKRVVIIEDVITTGGAIDDAMGHLRTAKADLLGVSCAIWRGPGRPALPGAPGLPVQAVFTAEDLNPSDGQRAEVSRPDAA